MRLFHDFPVRECRVTLFRYHFYCTVKEVSIDGDGGGDGDGDLKQWLVLLSHGGHLLVVAVKDTVLVSLSSTFVFCSPLMFSNEVCRRLARCSPRYIAIQCNTIQYHFWDSDSIFGDNFFKNIFLCILRIYVFFWKSLLELWNDTEIKVVLPPA